MEQYPKTDISNTRMYGGLNFSPTNQLTKLTPCMQGVFYSNITKIEKRGLTSDFAPRLMQRLKLLVAPLGALVGRRQLQVTEQKSRLEVALCLKE
jgi:hypothetical protein